MTTRIDKSGRLVIPKRFRSALGISPDTDLELIQDGTGLRLEPVQRRERSIGESDGLPVLGQVEGSALTDADVRALRDELQR